MLSPKNKKVLALTSSVAFVGISLALYLTTRKSTEVAQTLSIAVPVQKYPSALQEGSKITAIPSIPAPPATPVQNLEGDPKEGSSEMKAVSQVKPKITEGCFTLTYTHEQMNSHESGEACSKHKNQLALSVPEQGEDAVINPKSICVQVNGSTVKHQFDSKHPQFVTIGPEAGPHAKVSIRYCLGERSCPEKCPALPAAQDKFMAALGAGDSKDGVQEENAEIEKEMVTLVRKIDELATDSSETIFKDWLMARHLEACASGRNHAMAKLERE